jgi:hypothetical protein
MPCSDPQAPDRLYHYCSERAAADIVAEEPPYFVSGGGSHHGWGMYATDIEPLDADSIAEVSTSCFLGGATLADLSCVLVVRRTGEGQSFRETSNPHEWIIDCAAPLELVWLEDLLIEVLRWNGRVWVSVAKWDGYEMEVYDDLAYYKHL